MCRPEDICPNPNAIVHGYGDVLVPDGVDLERGQLGSLPPASFDVLGPGIRPIVESGVLRRGQWSPQWSDGSHYRRAETNMASKCQWNLRRQNIARLPDASSVVLEQSDSRGYSPRYEVLGGEGGAKVFRLGLRTVCTYLIACI
jgi:hypothetical protein